MDHLIDFESEKGLKNKYFQTTNGDDDMGKLAADFFTESGRNNYNKQINNVKIN